MAEYRCRYLVLLFGLIILLAAAYRHQHDVGPIHTRKPAAVTATLAAIIAPTVTGTPKSHVQFVISHYNENLDWLRPLANHSHVYHKGGAKAPPFPVHHWETLPNVGREGHTYLYHIIHNYDGLADLTVFLQGHGVREPNDPWCFSPPMDFVAKAAEGRYCKVIGALSNWEAVLLPRHSKWQQAKHAGTMRRARLSSVGAFYQAVFGAPHPASAPLCYTACFSATRDNLRRYPRSLYERAISYLDDHPDPEEGHMMERMWPTIINTKR